MAAIKTNEERFRAIIEHSSDAFRLMDKEGIITYASPSTGKILGYPENEYVGKSVFDFIHPNDILKYKEKVEDVVANSGKTITFIYRVRHKNASWLWIEGSMTNLLNNPAVSAIVSNFRDITQRKFLEEQLRISEQQLQSIVDGSPVVVYLKSREGRYMMVNHQYELLFNLSRKDIKGKTDYDIWPKDIADKINFNDQRVVQTEQPIKVEETILQEDGEHIYLSEKFPLFDSRGVPYAVCGILTDITEAKRNEERKDEFISMASHELKTPVTSIKGFTQLLQRQFENENNPKIKRYLSTMDDQINKLTKLITDLLDVTRMHKGQLQFHEMRFPIDALVEESIAIVQPSTENHKIILKDTTHVLIIGDRDRISQVVINLLTNAVKYSPGAKNIIVRLTADTENVVISVKDFGVGIPKKHQARIFERFYRVYDAKDKTFPGLGIGLFISNEIIKRHGGKMWVTSAKGKGATFFFSLPIKRKKIL